MGLFDYVQVSTADTRFVCSEGHQLGDEEFQSKDFGCTMGDVGIFGDSITIMSGGYGSDVSRPLLGRFWVHCSCTQCPAFVQAHTCNLIAMSIDFELEVIDDKIRGVTRIGPTTAEWLATELANPYMVGARGPMPWWEAYELHVRGERSPWPREKPLR